MNFSSIRTSKLFPQLLQVRHTSWLLRKPKLFATDKTVFDSSFGFGLRLSQELIKFLRSVSVSFIINTLCLQKIVFFPVQMLLKPPGGKRRDYLPRLFRIRLFYRTIGRSEKMKF